jgi:hypothetical protein
MFLLALSACSGQTRALPGTVDALGPDAEIQIADAAAPDAGEAAPDGGVSAVDGQRDQMEPPDWPLEVSAPDAALDVGAGPDGPEPDAKPAAAPDGPTEAGLRPGSCQPSDASVPYISCGCKYAPAFSRQVGPDDRTLGYSPRDVAAAFQASNLGELTWHDGTRTPIHLDLLYPDKEATISDPPPYQGYCDPSTRVASLVLTFRTDDGRLRDSNTVDLYGVERDGVLDHVFVYVPGVFIDKLSGTFSVPPGWLRADHDVRFLLLVINPRANLTNPFCTPGEVYDETPTSDCTKADGKILYRSMPRRFVEDHHAYDETQVFTALAGRWEWR